MTFGGGDGLNIVCFIEQLLLSTLFCAKNVKHYIKKFCIIKVEMTDTEIKKR